MLYIADRTVNDVWGLLEMLPLASERALFLRNINFRAEGTVGYATRHMIFHGCWATEASLRNILNGFRQLETLIFFETDVAIYDLASKLIALPTSLGRVHIIEHYFYEEHNPLDARHALPHLQSFTYTLLSSGESALWTPADDGNDNPDADALAEVQQAVESIVDAPQCTFKFLCSTEPEDALAGALAALKLDM